MFLPMKKRETNSKRRNLGVIKNCFHGDYGAYSGRSIKSYYLASAVCVFCLFYVLLINRFFLLLIIINSTLHRMN